MNFRSVLMTSAAAVALTTNAWAEQGDTYVSIFGGASEMTETSLLHYMLNAPDDLNIVDAFASGARRDALITINNFIVTDASHTVPLTYTSKTTAKTTTGPGTKIVTTTNVHELKTTSGATIFKRSFVTLSSTTVGQKSAINHSFDSRNFEGAFDTAGWVVGASVGVELFQNLRGEAEIAFRRFDMMEDATILNATHDHTFTYIASVHRRYKPIESGTLANALTASSVVTLPAETQFQFKSNYKTTDSPATADGLLGSFSFMANLWYDIPLGDTGIVPFIGVGVGAANLTIDYDITQNEPANKRFINYVGTKATSTATTAKKVVTTVTVDSPVTVQTNLKTDQAVFAYQFGAGIGYEFDNGVRLSAQYRYFATDDANFGPVTVGIETADIIAGLTIPFGDGGRRGRRR